MKAEGAHSPAIVNVIKFSVMFAAIDDCIPDFIPATRVQIPPFIPLIALKVIDSSATHHGVV